MSVLDPNRENHLRSIITMALNSSHMLRVQFKDDMTPEEFEKLWGMINKEEINLDTESVEVARFGYAMTLKRERKELQGSQTIWGPNKEITIHLLRNFNPKAFLTVVGRAIESIEAG